MKTLLRLLITVLILLISIATFLLTPTGLTVGIKLATRFIPGELHYKKISGVIIGPIVVDDLYYKNKEETIAIKKLTLNWQPLDLFKREFRISSLQINGATVSSKQNFLPAQWNEQTTKIFIASIIASLQKSSSLFHITINHAFIFDARLNEANNPTPLVIQKLMLHSEFTLTRWNTEFYAAITKPHPFEVHFHILGKPTQYHVQLGIMGYQTHFSVSGEGNQSSLHLATHQNQLLDGTLQLQLQFQWLPTITWNISLNSQKINTALIDPQWISPLSMDAVSSGALSHDKKNITTDTKATLKIPDGKLNLIAAHNTQWHIQWGLQVSSLSHWITDAHGAFKSQGTVSGDLLNPHFNIQLEGHYQKQKINITDAKITLVGNLKKHSLHAAIILPTEKLNVHLEGHLNKAEWEGSLQQFTAIMHGGSTWTLQKPTPIKASPDSITFSTLCLQQNHTGNVCIAGKILNQKIDGVAKINLHHLNSLTRIAPGIQISAGQLISNLQILGTLSQPSVTGSVNFNQGQITIPSINITLNNIHATLVGTNNAINFQAQALSKNQPIDAKGSVDLSNPSIPVTMTLTTHNLLFINTNEYTGYGTANLALNASLASKKITVTGTIIIPKGTIQPDDYQVTKTLPSSDIVYVGSKAPKQKSPWEILYDITATLGHQVHIVVAGFDAHIKGTLQLLQQPNQDLYATGEVFIDNGIYSVYGQTLKIQPNSYITYTHSLLNNPALSIQASKTISDVSNLGISGFSQHKMIVGIGMHGSVQSPKITFFSSDGNLSQADILSYIMLGYATARSNTPGNTDFLLRALAAVNVTSQGLLGKQNLATQIQNGLGLSEMGVESETTVDALGNPLNRQSAFVVGKSLSRNFYARYSFGLLDAVNVFQLKYILNRHWAVQTDSSSLGNGGDVLYTIEQK